MCGNIFRFAAAAGAVKEETERPGVGVDKKGAGSATLGYIQIILKADLDPFIRENTPFG